MLKVNKEELWSNAKYCDSPELTLTVNYNWLNTLIELSNEIDNYFELLNQKKYNLLNYDKIQSYIDTLNGVEEKKLIFEDYNYVHILTPDSYDSCYDAADKVYYSGYLSSVLNAPLTIELIMTLNLLIDIILKHAIAYDEIIEE